MSENTIMRSRHIIINKPESDEVIVFTVDESTHVVTARKLVEGAVVEDPITYTFEEFEKVIGF